MDCCNAYESDSMVKAFGETLRPGGYRLTEKAVRLCGLSEKHTVLDLGCGRGATVNYLYQTHGIRAVGIDPSEKLIQEAKRNCSFAELLQGKGESLPFRDGTFHCVFAECTLSLMHNLERTLEEVFRVLKSGGRLIITDVYAKNPQAAGELSQFAMNSCLRGIHNLAQLKENLKRTGFSISFLEDNSDVLKELMVKTIFTFGSMAAFWNLTSQNCVDGCRFEEVLRQCKPGYFLMIAKKG